jgi:hypothetical protein
MKLGIVGHEAAKFTNETEWRARGIIEILLSNAMAKKNEPVTIVSGGCHLGGIDIWAVEAAKIYDMPYIEFFPKTKQWSGGYKERNIQIAKESDKVVCIVVKKLPPEYEGMRFKSCYHCKTDTHVKSGGCWTARYAGKLGKPFEIIEI